MHQKASEPYFLHVYNVESGLWVSTKLALPVSPHSVEAMNLILFRDGIRAYIGTRSEFGIFLSRLDNETGKGLRPCWISLPAHTVMSKLGLCRSTANPENPSLDFHGSPSTRVLAWLIWYLDKESEPQLEREIDRVENEIRNQGYFILSSEMVKPLGLRHSTLINASEYSDAISHIAMAEMVDCDCEDCVADRERELSAPSPQLAHKPAVAID